MLRSLKAVAAISIFVSISACADNTPTDELAGEDASDAIGDGKADGAADGTYTYFDVRADLRKCLSPVCGGFFLDRLNRTTTVCADGHAKSGACYVPALDWSEAHLSDGMQSKLLDTTNIVDGNTHAIVRGRFKSKTYSGFGNMGTFVVTEAWVAETDAVASGVFAKIVNSGIVCITAPCPTLKEKGLNESRTANIAEVDWTLASLSAHEVEGFADEISSDHGSIIAGDRYTIGSYKGRTATAAFHRLVDPAAAP